MAKALHSLWPVWFAGGAHLATLAVGVLGIAMGGNLLWTAIAVFTGCAFGTFFMAVHSTQGPQLGLPETIESQAAVRIHGSATGMGRGAHRVCRLQRLQSSSRGAGDSRVGRRGNRPHRAVDQYCLRWRRSGLAAVGDHWIHVAQRWLAYALILGLTVFPLVPLFFVRLPPVQLDGSRIRGSPIPRAVLRGRCLSTQLVDLRV